MRLLCILSVASLISCSGGLEPPPPVVPGFSGTILFIHNSWPPADSLVGLWVFASQDYPIDSTKVFAGIFNAPFRIYLYPSLSTSLPFYQDSLQYVFPVPAGTYKYIGVIQQAASALVVRNFRVVGVVSDPADSTRPRTLQIGENSQLTGIGIRVDFRNLPPQPFR